MQGRHRKPIFDTILDILGVLSAIIIVGIMVMVLYEVVMRYFLGRPTLWVLEIVEWALVWMTFLSAAYVLKEERHVSMDIVVSRLSPRTQAMMGVYTSIAGALICIVLGWYGAQIVHDHIVRGVLEAKMLRAPKGPLMSVIPAGFFLMGIQFLRRSVNFFRKWKAM